MNGQLGIIKSLNTNKLWRSFFDQYFAHHNYLYRKCQVDHHVNLQNHMYGRIHNKLYLIFKPIGEKFDCRQWPRRRWLEKYSQAQFHLSSAYQIKKFELEEEV